MKLNAGNYDDMMCMLTVQSIIEELESMSVSSEDLTSLNRLKQMSLFELFDVAKNSVSVTMNIDRERFEAMVAKIEANKQVMNDFYWAIKNGATNTMLAQIFPSLFNERDIAKYRQGDAAFKRRSKIKDEVTQNTIFEVWTKSKAEGTYSNTNALLHLRAVFEHFNGEYDLGTIYGALCEHIDDKRYILENHYA